MVRWEMHDGCDQVGPLEEDHVLRMIASGIPEETVIRAEGEEEWRGLRSHAPFAIALAAAKKAKAAPQDDAPEIEPEPDFVDAPPIAPFDAPRPGHAAAVRRWLSARSTSELVVLGLGVAVTCVSIASAAAALREPPPIHRPPAPVAAPLPAPTPTPRPVPTMPTSVPDGTWAKIPRPGVEVEDTPATRLKYVSNVTDAVPGEPKVQKAKGTVLIQKLRIELAKRSSVPVASIKASVGDTSAIITVTDGIMAGLDVHGEARYFPVCSEGLFATAILTAGLSPEDFAKAGVRAVMCLSEGCTALFDMRPTSPGGGFYGGSSCLSMADMMRLAGLPVE